MNDLEFEQRATANPFDESSEFLAAIQEHPDRQKLLDELKAFETDMLQTVNSVTASDKLKQDLLDLAETEASPKIEASPDKEASPGKEPSPLKEAANDNHFWTRKVLPVAACLLVAIGITLSISPSQEESLDVEILAHIYSEPAFLEVDSVLPMSEVNQMMANTLGSQFKQSADLANLDIHVASDCVVAQQDSIHLVMEGEMGAVTVILLPSSPIEEERTISDDRFEGLITPTPAGNLIVVGEKSEAISQFSTMLATNINW